MAGSADRLLKADRARYDAWLWGLTVLAFEQANLLRTLQRHGNVNAASYEDVAFVHGDVLNFFASNLPKDVASRLRKMSAAFLEELRTTFAARDKSRS